MKVVQDKCNYFIKFNIAQNFQIPSVLNFTGFDKRKLQKLEGEAKDDIEGS